MRRKALVALVALACLGASFSAGYLAGRGATPGLVPAPPSPTPALSAEAVLVADGLTEAEARRLALLAEVWRLLDREYYDQAALADSRRLAYGAIRGMLETLGDSHTLFQDPQQSAHTDEVLRNATEGIGVQLSSRDGRVIITAALPGSPAEQAGLRSGDEVVAVDGQPVAGEDAGAVAERIRGPSGTTVALLLRRDGVELQTSVTRAPIRVDTVQARMLEGGVLYLKLSLLSDQTGAELERALRQHAGEARAYLLDLRGNPGGFVTSAVDVASQFLGAGVVFQQERAGGERETYEAKGGGLALALPLAVLIDRGTASAAEIVAAALHDNRRAVLVGERSFGKGTVQTIHRLSDSSSVRITTARWLGPRGNPLPDDGVAPDIYVEPGPGDPQLARAHRHLQRLAGGGRPPG